MRFLLALIAGCSGAAPAPTPPPLRPPPIDAGVDATPDAGITADPWVFRYHTAQRDETWTLRWQETRAQIVVEGTTGTQRYWGTASDGKLLGIEVSTGTAKLSLACDRVQKPLSKKCNDKKAAPVELLDCHVAGFDQPMPFARAPGVEFVVDASCNGYRLIQ